MRRITALLLAGLYQYTVRDFVVSFGLEASPVDLNSLDQFYEERAGQVSGENEYTGLYEGKSLLMVMLGQTISFQIAMIC